MHATLKNEAKQRIIMVKTIFPNGTGIAMNLITNT